MQKKLFWQFIALLLVIGVSILTGRYSLLSLNYDEWNNQFLWNLIFKLRIPRVLTAVIAGAALSLSGYVIQTILHNPLADPGIIGISQASGFGAALGILLFESSSIFTQLLAFIFSLTALGLTFFLAKQTRSNDILAVVLSGIAVSAIFSAGLGLIKYIADPIDQLPNIVFWLLGSISNVNWQDLIVLLCITLPIMVLLWFYRWRLNIFQLEDEIAFSLGMNKNTERFLVICCAVLLTSSVISFTGIIGWVGLIIPNMSRFLWGQNAMNSLPKSALLGALFLLICDNFSRLLLPGEIPLGILTAFFGSLLFVYFLVKRKFLK
jgi:iron complex transport system permease protein